MAEQGAPSGVVTFLFTDMESSTWLVQHLGDRWDEALHEHDRLLREAWAAHEGYEVSTEGDAFFVVFEHAGDAIRAALDAQQRLAAHAFEEPIRVRIGLHTGEARVYGSDYVGLAVHQAARVKSAAHGGQVIVSDATKSAAGDVCEFVELGLHRLKDLAQPVRLFQAGVGEFPPPKTLTVMPNNFPVRSTTFIGRDDDIAAVKDVLRTSRLATLTGAGGVGKTRLSLQVAADMIDDFGDGAWLIDLAPLSDPEGVARQTAEVLGVREQPGRDISATVADALLAKHTLLVLDNCEHLIDASAQLVHRLLATCPHVKVLATSREALNVAGEVTYRLRSLAVPEVDVGSDLGQVAQAESVRLFTQRAVAVRTGFELTADNAAAVSQICRRLDGLPLAIELAAARAKVMSPQEIAGRLDDRFRLLTGGTRMALPRQRTLEATVSWSYDLLSDHERLLFDRLSVFAGGCTLEAAERVCVGDGIESFEVVDILTQLVDRSLVVAEANPGTTRYLLLETLRQFGRDRLLARGEIDGVRDRLLAWSVDLVATLAAHLPAETGANVPPEIAAEEENLRAAIEWAIGTGKDAAALQVLADLFRTGGHRAFPERERWNQALLPSIDRVTKEVACRVLAEAGGVSLGAGDWAAASERFSRAADAALEIGDARTVAMSLVLGGSSLWGLNEDDEALRLIERGVRVAADLQDTELMHFGSIVLAWTCSDRDVEAALGIASEVDELTRREGTSFNRAHSRESLGYVQAVRGDVASARATLAEASKLFVDVLVDCSAHMLETAATLLTMEDRFERAAELLGAAERIREERGDRPRPWERTVQEVWLPKIRASLEAPVYEAALLRGRALPREDALARAGHLLSEPR